MPPLNNSHTTTEEKLIQVNRISITFDTVDIQVVKWQTPFVLSDNGIGWTFNHLTDIQALSKALCKGCFTRTQLSSQDQNIVFLKQMT